MHSLGPDLVLHFPKKKSPSDPQVPSAPMWEGGYWLSRKKS